MVHREAVEATITLPKPTADVGALLSKTHKVEEVARDMLKIILSSMRYWQGVEDYPCSVESLYRQVYFEAIDLAMNSIKSHFEYQD